MLDIEEKPLYCPYCGEPISLLVDSSEAGESYIEDCQVCCQPIVISVSIEGEALSISAKTENE
jgi:hypothetical protein